MVRRLTAAAVSLVVLPLLLSAQRPPTDTIVSVATSPRHAGFAALVPELEIADGADADGFYFGAVSGVAEGPSGSVYVHDHVTPTLRLYDARGRFVRTIGRTGSGPGEYRRISGVATLPDGRVLLLDTGNWRINVYAADGTYHAQWPVPNRGGSAQMVGRHTLTVSRSGIVSVMYTDRSLQHGWIRLRSDGRVLDTVMALRREDMGLSAPASSPALRATSPDGKFNVSVPSLSSVAAQWSSLPGGVLLHAPGSQYRVDIARPVGRVLRIQREVRGTPYSAAERQLVERELTAMMRIVDPRWRWSDAMLGAARPAMIRAELGDDERIWVLQRHEGVLLNGGGSGGTGASAESLSKQLRAQRQHWCRLAGAAFYDVYEPDGVFVGSAKVPACHVLWRMSGDAVWAAEMDADDVVTLRRYRVRWGAP
jgi:hypothetical protein